MLIEWLLTLIQDPMIWDIMIIGAFAIPIALVVILAFFMKKFSSIKFMADAQGGKLAVICDVGANQAWFYPMRRSHDVNFIKERGIRIWDREGTFFSPQLMMSVGIMISNAAVTLPLKYDRFVNFKNKKDYQVQTGTVTMQDPSTGKVSKTPTLEWVTLSGFSQWLARTNNPYTFQSDLEYRAKVFGEVNLMDKEANKPQENAKKSRMLIILVVLGVIGIAVAFFVMKGGG